MRLGDSEREELFERLSRHAAAGRLDLEELERRVAAVAAAGTREEAAAVLADLPPLVTEAAARARGRPRRGRGHGDADAPGSDWRPTAERFRDPRTGRVMRVWEDAAGGRHYVVDDGGA
ncbi:MAG TPA: DUF1707 domain-containing protein [Solirubrobacteraceae bacterium]|nr:DUF1707 domain-containing protein [Solirubrobacteraceae bacterium]